MFPSSRLFVAFAILFAYGPVMLHEALLARRFAIIQVWRAINQPIESNPLAVADAQTLDEQDLLIAEPAKR